MHGDADNTVNVSGSRNMVAALKKAGADVTYIEVPGGSHTDVVVPNLPQAFEFMAAQKKGAAAHMSRSRSSEPPSLESDSRPDARITVLTGAGVSAASGVPTFRGADGLWKNFQPGNARHRRSLRARSAARVGVVRLAALADRRVRAERGASRARRLEPALSELHD